MIKIEKYKKECIMSEEIEGKYLIKQMPNLNN